MFDSESTKIIQLLANRNLKEAMSLFQSGHFEKSVAEQIQYLLYLEEDKIKAVNFWKTISMDKVDPLMSSVIEPFNLYVLDEKEALNHWLTENKPDFVFNVVEAANLAFYAHHLRREDEDDYRKRAQQLHIQSELMKPFRTEEGYSLFSPITLYLVQASVIRFLKDNFETQDELDRLITRLKNDKPI